MTKTWKKDKGPGVYPIAERPIQQMKQTRGEIREDARKYTEMVNEDVRRAAYKRLAPQGQIDLDMLNAEQDAAVEEPAAAQEAAQYVEERFSDPFSQELRLEQQPLIQGDAENQQ